MKGLLAHTPRPDGVFCFNDPVAAGAKQAVLEAGLAIPKGIALIGVANMLYSNLLAVPLSTLDQNAAEMSTHAAHRLMECIDNKQLLPPKKILIPSDLIVRASSARRK